MNSEATETGVRQDPHWYKDAIIYQLHVKAFFDSDGNGMGDFRGLTEKLDYVESLGVNTLWLLPFYPSPMRDDGYDIADYRHIYEAYGTRADFGRLIREAHHRGIRVITELVINHTSDAHPWFQAARRAPRGSAKRNYYVWSDTDEKYAGTRIIFTDTETSNWTWDPVAQQYYWHRFFSHQPDLNFDNPSVVRAVIRVMRFWLDMGVDGLRLDAIPYLCEREGTTNENLPETHAVVKQMRKVVDENYEERMFLGEANMWPEDVMDYFGDGDECHMAYHFPLMPRMYMALAQEDRHPVVEILEQTPAIPDGCQWSMFLRNHDELTLEMVTDEERDYMYQTYARDPRSRINVGIRRRLAPLLGNDPEKIKLLTSLLLSMPGSPILYYGDEIGMGDNIYLGDRNGVRTPMQWSPDRNAGFSKADPQQLYLPPVMDPVYGYESVNVEAQSRDVSSLLNWMRRMIAVRKSTPAFGRGSLTMLAPGNRHVFAYLREYDEDIILCVANLAGTAQPVELDLSSFKGLVPVEMAGRSNFPPIGELPYFLTLAGHGFFWFRLTSEASVPEWHSEGTLSGRLLTLVLIERLESFLPDALPVEKRRVSQNMLRRFLSGVLPRFLSSCQWFPLQEGAIESIEITRRLIWQTKEEAFLLLWLRTAGEDAGTGVYLLPLALSWGSDQEKDIRDLLNGAVARVRERARTGVLYEAVRNGQFCCAVIDTIRTGASTMLDEHRLVGTPTSAAAEMLAGLSADATLELPPSGRRNTTIILGEQAVLKLIRDQRPGPCAELEISRFLTEQNVFHHFPRLGGDLSLQGPDGKNTLALALEYKRHQGDAWRNFHHHLDRFLDEARLRPAEETRAAFEAIHAEPLSLLMKLGHVIGELHLAFSKAEGAFAPLPVGDSEPAEWKEAVQRRVEPTLRDLAGLPELLPEPDHTLVRELLSQGVRLRQRISSLPVDGFRGLKCRYHGDLRLSRVLIVEGDLALTDFASDAAVQAADPRHSPLRDIAEVLRSIDRIVQTALTGLTDLTPGNRENIVREFALDWQQRANRTVIEAYRHSVADSPLYASDARTIDAVTELFVLEKALFEVRHASSQIEGERILPIRGLLGLLGRLAIPEEA